MKSQNPEYRHLQWLLRGVEVATLRRLRFLEFLVYLVYIETSIRSDPNGSGNRAGDANGALKVKTFDVQEQ